MSTKAILSVKHDRNSVFSKVGDTTTLDTVHLWGMVWITMSTMAFMVWWNRSVSILQMPSVLALKTNQTLILKILPCYLLRACQENTIWHRLFDALRLKYYTPASNLGYLAPPRTIFYGCQIVHWDPLNAKRRCPQINFGLGYVKLHGFYGNP